MSAFYKAGQHQQGLDESLCLVSGTARFLGQHLFEADNVALQKSRTHGVKAKSERSRAAFLTGDAQK